MKVKFFQQLLPLLWLISSHLDAAWAESRPKVDAVSFKPAKAPGFTGPLTRNEELRRSVSLAEGLVSGPEEFAMDDEGRLYTGSSKGLVQRLNLDGSVETYAVTGGHPLGMDFTADGELIVCEPEQGLLAITPERKVRVLSQEADGIPFKLVDDATVASDGLIYFTDASSKFNLEYFRYDILEARGNGRLLVYDPETELTTVLLDGLYFANGVTLSADESYLLVAETGRYQIRRYWLKGPRRGENEVFAENLPGFPDGISRASDGNYWVALFAPRSKQIDKIQPFAALKNLLAKLPASLLPEPDRYGLVVKYDQNGEAVTSLHDTKGTVVANATSVFESDGYLYLGSLAGEAIYRYQLD